MSEARRGSRLELDDGEYCKRCGAELPGSKTNPDGQRIIWDSDGLEWNVIELCPECWTEKRLQMLRGECMARYAGECSEVLWNA